MAGYLMAGLGEGEQKRMGVSRSTLTWVP